MTLVKGRDKKERASEKWKPPDEGWIKINVDGAFDSAMGEGGLGVAIRDHLGSVLLAACLGLHGQWKGCGGVGGASLQRGPKFGLGMVPSTGRINHGQ